MTNLGLSPVSSLILLILFTSDHQTTLLFHHESEQNNYVLFYQIGKSIIMEAPASTVANSLFWSTIEKFRKEGVIVISNQLSILYIDQKAKELSQVLPENQTHGDNLTTIISEMAYQFSKKSDMTSESIVKDYHLSEQHSLRMRTVSLLTKREHWSNEIEEPWMIIFIEDPHEHFLSELKIEQEKYGLTDREADVYSLLLQSRSYKDIARELGISLNTVRFHIKNINFKKRSYLE
jgi:DNA-binding CsgD family transcriptional regulator